MNCENSKKKHNMENHSSQAWPGTARSLGFRVEKMREVLMHGRDKAAELRIALGKPPKERGSTEEVMSTVLQAFIDGLSMLNSDDGKFCDAQVDSPSSAADQIISGDPAGEKRKYPASKDRRGGYKRRKASHSWTKLTPTPVDDGFAWRKYGQKEILNAKHPRNYFRCTHKHDQGCLATKQVQRTEDDPPTYRTIYMGRHTCRDTLRAPQLVLDSNLYLEDSSCLLNFQSNDLPSCSSAKKQGFGSAYFSSLISGESVKSESDLMAHNIPSASSEYLPVRSPDLASFESSGPSNLLAGTASGSEYGDVISSVYSSNSSDEHSLDMDDFFNGHSFGDLFDEEL